MRFDRFDPLTDTAALAACHEIIEAARVADDPAAPVRSPAEVRNWWGYGFEGRDPRQAWLATDERGPAGCYLLELPDRENVAVGTTALFVPPSRRRHGIGTALLARCAAQAAAAGRTTLLGTARLDTAGGEFARAAGAAGGLTDVRRGLRPADLTPERLAGLRTEAADRSGGYTLLTWTGPAPDDQVDQVARLWEALGDAPREAALVAPSIDADRVRAIEAPSCGPGFGLYTVAARHDASGELAALTQVITETALPGQALQGITVVARRHRGRRLGLLIKVAVHQWLADAAPGLRAFYTWNGQATST